MSKTFNILSYGESLNCFFEYGNLAPGEPGHDTVIAVNHTGRFFPNDIDQLILIDHPAYFTPEKIKDIQGTEAETFFIINPAWYTYLPGRQIKEITLAPERSILRTLEGHNFEQIPFSYNSPFIAACMAIRQGATRINLFGIDFNYSSDAGTELNAKNIRDFTRLYLLACTMNIKMYTTPESKLRTFMPINPNLKTLPVKAL